MTVKSILPRDKNLIAEWHRIGMHTKQEMAEIFDVSVRTIERVLIEKGVMDAPKQRITPQMRAYMQVLSRYNLSPEQLDEVLTNHKYPYQAVQGYLHQCSPSQIAGIIYKRFMGKPPVKRPLQLSLDHSNAQTRH